MAKKKRKPAPPLFSAEQDARLALFFSAIVASDSEDSFSAMLGRKDISVSEFSGLSHPLLDGVLQIACAPPPDWTAKRKNFISALASAAESSRSVARVARKTLELLPRETRTPLLRFELLLPLELVVRPEQERAALCARIERDCEEDREYQLMLPLFDEYVKATAAVIDNPAHPVILDAIETLEYFVCDIVFLRAAHRLVVEDSGYDVSTRAAPTNEPLDVEEFFSVGDLLQNALSGNTRATYCSGSGFSAETWDSSWDYEALLHETVVEAVRSVAPDMLDDEGQYVFYDFSERLCEELLDLRLSELFFELPLLPILRSRAEEYLAEAPHMINARLADKLRSEAEAESFDEISAAPSSSQTPRRI